MKDIYMVFLTIAGVLLFFFFQRYIEHTDSNFLKLETEIEELKIKCQ